jgi:hypothetical protein
MVTFFGQSKLYNPRGRAQILRKRMVVEGEIIATTTAIDTRMQEIIAIFSADGGSASFVRSNGAVTAYNLPSTGSISGVRVVQPPSFIQQEGKAHMTTGLPFTVVLEADYPILDGFSLVSYSESITRIGQGGPRRVTVELDSGAPLEQIVSNQTPITIIQQGEAVGELIYPTENPPIFPSQIDLPDGYQLSQGAPRLDGQTYVDWPIRWAYRMTLTTATTIPPPLPR